MARNTSSELKRLQGRLHEVEVEQKDLLMKGEELSKRMKELAIEKRKCQDAIEKIKRDDTIVISEHAILRYLERVKGVNIEELKEEIWPKSDVNQRMCRTLGNGEFPVNNHRVVIKNNVIVSVLEP